MATLTQSTLNHSSPTPEVPAIEFRGVSISFDRKPVFEDVSFCLGRGETLFLLGVTGTGKSVLLKLCLGLLKPDAGDILIDGENIVPLTDAELSPVRRKMGMVFQEGALFESLTVYDNVAYRLHEDGTEDEDAVERRVREVLSFVEMEDAIWKMPSELSGGMRRRVSIARAIASKPSILLYDSPTAGLDPVTANTINILIAKTRDVRHATSVVVTHRIPDAAVLTQSVYSETKQGLVAAGSSSPASQTHFLILRDGRTYFYGGREELGHTLDAYLRRFLA